MWARRPSRRRLSACTNATPGWGLQVPCLIFVPLLTPEVCKLLSGYIPRGPPLGRFEGLRSANVLLGPAAALNCPSPGQPTRSRVFVNSFGCFACAESLERVTLVCRLHLNECALAAGCSTPLHRDPYRNALCQVRRAGRTVAIAGLLAACIKGRLLASRAVKSAAAAPDVFMLSIAKAFAAGT